MRQTSLGACCRRCVPSESPCTFTPSHLQQVTLATNIWQDARSVSFLFNLFCLTFLSLWLSYATDTAQFLYLSETISFIWVQGGQISEQHDKLTTLAPFPPPHTSKECLARYRLAFTFHSSIYLISSSFKSTYFTAKCSYFAGSTCWLDLLILHPIHPHMALQPPPDLGLLHKTPPFIPIFSSSPPSLC